MISLFEGIKKYLPGSKNSKNKNSLKLQKKNFFIKDDTLAKLSHHDVNELANVLVSWYKVRMPDGIFMKDENDIVINKNDVSYKNYVSMSFDELLKRNTSLSLLKCSYRNGSPYDKGTLVLEIFTTKGLLKNKKDKICRILADRNSGKIIGIEGDYLLPDTLNKNYRISQKFV